MTSLVHIHSRFLLLIALLLLVTGLAIRASAQTASVQDVANHHSQAEQQIQQAMETHGRNFLKNHSVPSISIGVYKDGTAYSGHYGELQPGKSNTPNSETLYSIASITKTMTGTVAAQAVLDRKIALDDDVRDYLVGDFPNLEHSGTSIKIRHLLTHMSGLPSDPPGFDRMFQKMDFTLPYPKESFFADLRAAKIKTEPGTQYNYSGFGTILISYVLESVYEKPFETLLKEFIFREANMTQTKINLSAKEREKLVLGYHNGKTAIDIPLHLTGAESMVKSTITDLLKYIKFQLNEERPIVREDHKKLHDARWMGYFWQIWNDGDVLYYQHAGNAPGTTSWIMIFPKYQMGICAVTNTRSQNMNDIMYYEVVMNLLDDLRPSGKSVAKAINRRSFESASEIINFYQTLKQSEPQTYLFSDISGLYSSVKQLLKNGKPLDAIKVARLMVSEFPESSAAYDGLGEAYFSAGDKKNAVATFQKSLQLNPENRNAKTYLERMKN